MIVDINGAAECDRCGADLGITPPVTICLVVSDVVDGRVFNRHFCRFSVKGAPDGCAGLLMSDRNLKHAEKRLAQIEEARSVALENE